MNAVVEGVRRLPALAVTTATVVVDGVSHRIYWRRDGDVEALDCSCQERHCAAAAALRNHAVPWTKAAQPPTAKRAIYYDLDTDYQLCLRVAETPSEPGSRLEPRIVLASPTPRFATPEDAEIAHDLLHSELQLRTWPLLQRILRTGRARRNGRVLREGEPVTGTLRWRVEPDGCQRLLTVLPDGLRPVHARLPVVAVDSDTLAPIRCGERVGEVPPDAPLELTQAARWSEISPWRHWAELARPPYIPESIREQDVTPRGQLRLVCSEAITVHAAFVYGSVTVPVGFPGRVAMDTRSGVAVRHARDAAAEQSLLDGLRAAGLSGTPPRFDGGPLALARFQVESRETLERVGWTINIEGLPQIVTGDSSSMLWDLGDGRATLKAGGQRLQWRTERVTGRDHVFIQTLRGAVVAIPIRLFEDIDAALKADQNGFASRAAALGMEVEGAPEVAHRLETLRDPEAPALPQGITAQPREYQTAGFGWLQRLYRARFGAVLADDMGLGKTLQTLLHLAAIYATGETRPSLVVAPASVASNWRREAQRFAPTLKVTLYHGPQRRASWLDRHQVCITSYALLRSDAETLGEREWAVVVLDEAQTIKNPSSRTAVAARSLKATQRLALSGTPFENHLGELWSLLRFAEPGALGSMAQFQREFREPIERRADDAARQRLSRRLAPFLLRRTRDEVLAELPPRIEHDVFVQMDEPQRQLYETVRASALTELAELGGDAIADRGRVLRILTRLRQICCAPQLLPPDFPGREAPSAKLEHALKMLAELVDEGRRILVFSQFRSLLELMDLRLRALDIAALQLTGVTRNRDAVISQFQSGAAPVFLISLRAGGAGLNLTRADTVMLLDPWWNPSVEAQAIARAHRLGQERGVFVYRMLAADSIEEQMQRIKAAKGALTEDFGAAMADHDPTDPAVLARLLGAPS